MGTELLLCISQDEIAIPYRFKTTGINVYSFEEAVYHCYHYWKQSIDDFMSEEFLEWLREGLGLAFLASRIKSLSTLAGFVDRLVGFLSLADYFDEVELNALKAQLMEWETRLEWERLKERADYLMEKSDPTRAYMLYRKALDYGENLEILNNMAIALMRLEHFDQSEALLERALVLSPDNLQLLLNLAESAIYNHNFVRVEECLRAAEAIDPQAADIAYLYGELNMETNNIRHSIEFFEKALAVRYDPHYIYRIAGTYVKLRQYDNALEVLTKIKVRDKAFLTQQANVYAAANNLPAAIKCIERALLYERDSVSLWTSLARYHRLDYDITGAVSAITTALAIAPEDDRALLENARIKKAQGKTKEYQVALHNILSGFKRKYRDFTQAVSAGL